MINQKVRLVFVTTCISFFSMQASAGYVFNVFNGWNDADINNKGQVAVGIGNQISLLDSIVNTPATNGLEVGGINDNGVIAGTYRDSYNNGSHGFISSQNNFTTIDAPNTSYTYLTDINNKGQVAGVSINETGGYDVFTEYNGTFNYINTGSHTSWVNSINNNGQVVGWSYASNGSYNSFYTNLDGTVKNLSFSGWSNIYATDINDDGVVVGNYIATNDTSGWHGFTFDGNTFNTFSVPEATSNTWVNSINNNGDTAGAYWNNTGTHGFVEKNGLFTTLDVPNAKGFTMVNKINDNGQVVGYYADGIGTPAFFASEVSPVPEPESITLMLLGFPVVAWAMRRKKTTTIPT